MRSPIQAQVADDRQRRRGIRVRVGLVVVLFAVGFLVLAARAYSLQLVEGARMLELAQNQYFRQQSIAGRRGSIIDRTGAPLATTVDVDSIFADPALVVDPAATAKSLARVLKLEPAKLGALDDPKSRFTWVKRRVTPEEAAAVRALNLPGIAFTREPRRYYAQRELGCHVLGVSGVDGEGLDGIEWAFNEALKGKPMSMSGLRDARGRGVVLESRTSLEELEGATITLTLDKAIQLAAQQAVSRAAREAKAAAGIAIVVNPQTGEILALANWPEFNPNDPGASPKEALRNRAVTDQFEPGSTLKALTVAGGLEHGLTSSTPIDCERGVWRIGKHAIHDHGGYSVLDVAGVLRVSSNIGAAKIGMRIGRAKLAQIHSAFGLGEKPGTGLPGETRGKLPRATADISLAANSFGQGLTASPIQLTMAYAALANKGLLMQPWIVASVKDGDQVLVQGAPTPVRQAVSAKTADEVVRMMRGVVGEGGTGTRARLDAFDVAGKTGTSQKADARTGRYSVDKRVASFVGIVPADAPRLVIGVWIDEPRTDVYGGVVAAPAFREIAEAALAQLGVGPSKAPKNQPATAPPSIEVPSARAVALASLSAAPGAEPRTDGIVEEEEAPENSAVVPALVGLGARAAVQKLVGSGFEPVLEGFGTVISQDPPPQNRVAQGSRVVVSLEPPRKPTPTAEPPPKGKGSHR